MNRRRFVTSALVGLIGASVASPVRAQPRPIAVPLGELAARGELRAVNRAIARLQDGAREGVTLTESPGEGIVFISDIEFSTGTIECDFRGKDLAQRSFIGVAFHGADLGSCDAIYFRPFNFRAADLAARARAVQYHSLPAYTWQRLRAEQPGRYEQPVSPVPDPNAWFRARIVVAASSARVYVADAAEPCLAVNLLNDRRRGSIGLWVGNNSGGDFANLVVTPGAV
jgi:hypothetical protein